MVTLRQGLSDQMATPNRVFQFNMRTQQKKNNNNNTQQKPKPNKQNSQTTCDVFVCATQRRRRNQHIRDNARARFDLGGSARIRIYDPRPTLILCARGTSARTDFIDLNNQRDEHKQQPKNTHSWSVSIGQLNGN